MLKKVDGINNLLGELGKSNGCAINPKAMLKKHRQLKLCRMSNQRIPNQHTNGGGDVGINDHHCSTICETKVAILLIRRKNLLHLLQ